MCEFQDIGGVPYLRLDAGLVSFARGQIQEISQLNGKGAVLGYLRGIMVSLTAEQRESLKTADYAELPAAALRYLNHSEDTGE